MLIVQGMKRERDIGEYFGGSKKVKVKVDVEVEVTNEKKSVVPISQFKKEFQEKLNDREKELLALEIDTMEDSWFEALSDVFTQDWFLDLKQFIRKEFTSQTIYPPREDIYSWSKLTPLKDVRCIIIGQDPYHGPNQAHGLAFSVKGDTKIPPSLRNIYKGVKADYPNFVIPSHGDLTSWAKQGVLLLNTVLTVRAASANSHAGHGWERFTREVLSRAVQQHGPSISSTDARAIDSSAQRSVVMVAWGKHAERVAGQVMDTLSSKEHAQVHILKGCHPSPLSAHRGFFEQGHFKQVNELLGEERIDWCNCVKG